MLVGIGTDLGQPPDLLIAGAGPVGCVVAERAATERGWTSLTVKRRAHIAGNCYDRTHESGVLIHQYGPHYFRMRSTAIRDYLSRFTAWIPGNYRVRSLVGGRLYPFPINLDTLSDFFGTALDATAAETLLASKRVPYEQPLDAEQFVLSQVGRELYEAFYLGYTTKQWGRHPSELDPAVCGRIPVRLNHDDRYVDAEMQMMPARGYTAMFEQMIDTPLVQVLLGTDYANVRGKVIPRRATVYCGPLDVYFDRRLGPLPWRSLEFELQAFEEAWKQPCVQINYPDASVPYTRTVEIKHVTGQQHDHTVVSTEYPRAEGEPFYPVPALRHRQLAERYIALADEEQRRSRVYFAGRLARYVYMDTDEAIQVGLDTYAAISADTT